MVCSLDGYIGKADGDTSWMAHESHYPTGTSLSQEYVDAVLDNIDCYVMGSKTYEKTLELGWAYGDKPVVVVSSKERQSHRSTVSFFKGAQQPLIDTLHEKGYEKIWVVGGASLVKEYLINGFADQIIITFLPIIIGEGTLFFNAIGKEIKLELSHVEAFDNGMIEMTYQINKTEV